MSNVVPFRFEDKDVRTVIIDGEPWFVGKDVAELLGYANPTDAMNQHCRGVAKRYPIVDALGRNQETRILSEPDVLRLIIGSRLPAAERFERWVFEEVLPAIRRHGSYAMPGTVPLLTPGDREARLLALAESRHLLEKVKEARCSFGPLAARVMWRKVGFEDLTVPEGASVLDQAEDLARRVDEGVSTTELAVEGGVTTRQIQLMIKVARELSPKGKEMLGNGTLLFTYARHLSMLPQDAQEPILDLIAAGEIAAESELVLAVRMAREGLSRRADAADAA